MSAFGPPVRFVAGVLGLWVGARAAMLWEASGALGPAERPAIVTAKTGRPALRPTAPVSKMGALHASGGAQVALASLTPLHRRPGAGRGPPLHEPAAAESGTTVDPGPRRDDGAGVVAVALSAEPPAGLAAAPASPVRAVAAASVPRRWSGSAWLFGRGGGGGVALAGAGQLGASQAGARVAYTLDEGGHVAAAARVYTPLHDAAGAEAAVGVDLHPIPAIHFRLSVERRVAIGREGRSAWSAYAAGGFFRGLPGKLELDGYGQAGVVGARSHDLFADGALRIARREALGHGADLLVGAGVWGAAQPGAARLDVGPHVAVRVPVGATTLSAAADWRLRAAGDARPGSGAALTLAADF